METITHKSLFRHLSKGHRVGICGGNDGEYFQIIDGLLTDETGYVVSFLNLELEYVKIPYLMDWRKVPAGTPIQYAYDNVRNGEFLDGRYHYYDSSAVNRKHLILNDSKWLVGCVNFSCDICRIHPDTKILNEWLKCN